MKYAHMFIYLFIYLFIYYLLLLSVWSYIFFLIHLCNFIYPYLFFGLLYQLYNQQAQRHGLTHWGRGKWTPFRRRHFRIFFNENVWISIKISLKFVPKGPIKNIPAMVQIMAWHRPGDKPLSELMMVSLPTHICVARPQWVKSSSTKLPQHSVNFVHNSWDPMYIYIYILIYVLPVETAFTSPHYILFNAQQLYQNLYKNSLPCLHYDRQSFEMTQKVQKPGWFIVDWYSAPDWRL